MTKIFNKKGVNFIVSKCIKYYGKRLVKLSSIIAIGLFIIALFICVKYKPLYKVTLDGKVIGYVEDKDRMQEKIDKFANNLEGNITSIKVEVMPAYELELVSNVKESETKEQEVLALIEENAEIKCRTYAIKLDGNEKACVNSMEEAEAIVSEIKANVVEPIELNLEIEEQERNKKEITETTIDIAKVELNKDVDVKVQAYEAEQEAIRKAEEEARKAEKARRARAAQVSARNNVARSSSTAGASIPATGAAFMRPVSGGMVTSPFGYRTSGFHKGVDIATSTGTPIYASAEGTVIFSGWNSTGYGNLVIVDHGNGYQTYYAHCSQLYVSYGQYVSQGQNIAAVGSTGNSTGPHVHFQVMYYGAVQNPQNYIW